jgi:hypothetical protein
MLSNKLTKEELEELKAYIKQQSGKLKQEGSTTAGLAGYPTPAAFTGKQGGDGTDSIDLEKDEYAYSIKASKKKPHFIKLHEVSYKNFKEDANTSEVQKVNNKIIEVSKMLREISRSLDHSIKLKQESKLDDSKYWKRTNEAILKISRRLAEVNKKARKLANLKELAASSVKDRLVKLFNKAGIDIKAPEVEYQQKGTDIYEFDIYIAGEPYGIDYMKGEVLYQGMDKEERLGNINQEEELVKNIAQTFKP